MEREIRAYAKRIFLAGCMVGGGVGLSIGVIVGALIR